MGTDELTLLREENARLKAELAETRHRWERELIVAKASLFAEQEAHEATKTRLRAALLRTLEAEDEVFSVKEDAAKAVQTLRDGR